MIVVAYSISTGYPWAALVVFVAVLVLLPTAFRAWRAAGGKPSIIRVMGVVVACLAMAYVGLEWIQRVHEIDQFIFAADRAMENGFPHAVTIGPYPPDDPLSVPGAVIYTPWTEALLDLLKLAALPALVLAPLVRYAARRAIPWLRKHEKSMEVPEALGAR